MVLKSIELNPTAKTNYDVMSRRKSVTHFVAVNDLEQPPSEQEGLLIEVPKKGGDIPVLREQALQIVLEKWEKGEIEDTPLNKYFKKIKSNFINKYSKQFYECQMLDYSIQNKLHLDNYYKNKYI